MACCDDPHWRSMVTPGTLSGSPADSHAFLAMSIACGPTWETHPMMTSSIADGSTPVLAISSRSTWPAMSTGWTAERPPFRLPMGLRTAPTMYASDTETSKTTQPAVTRCTRCPMGCAGGLYPHFEATAHFGDGHSPKLVTAGV